MNKPGSTDDSPAKQISSAVPGDKPGATAWSELEKVIFSALEMYSNVHRGSGHKSMVTTCLYDHARDVVLEYLGLNHSKYSVIFSNPFRAEILMSQLRPGSYRCLSGRDFGLSLGVRALAVEKKALPSGVPFHRGGGTAKLVSPGWVIWADAPDRFEAGTPAIINVIAFAKALQLTNVYGNDVFTGVDPVHTSASDILYHDALEEFSGKELLEKLKETMIGRTIQVPTEEGFLPFINLDNAASTPSFAPVWDAFRLTVHQPLQVQREIIDEVRAICSRFMDAPLADHDIIFTSNTTEAINLAAESLCNNPAKDTETVVLNTILEHNSNDLPWRMPPHISLIRMEVDNKGFVDTGRLENILSEYNQRSLYGRKRIRLMALSGASNVLGTLNDLEKISRIVHRFGAVFLVDAAQLAAHSSISMQKYGIDYLAFSAHKMYAPFGTGVLVVRKGLMNLSPEKMELVKSSGEENTGGIAALGKSLILLNRIGLDVIREDEQALTARVLKGIKQIRNITVYGINETDSPFFRQRSGVIVFALRNKMANVIAMELADKAGIGIRYGCHCAHIMIKHLVGVTPFLERLQRLLVNLIPGLKLPGLARVSLGIGNTKEHIDAFVSALEDISKNQRASIKKGFKKKLDDFTRDEIRKVYALP